MLKRKNKRQQEESARSCGLDDDTKVGKDPWSSLKATAMKEGWMAGAEFVSELFHDLIIILESARVA